MGGGGVGGVAGPQPMSAAAHRSPNKLRRSNCIFNLWLQFINSLRIVCNLQYIQACRGALCIMSLHILQESSSFVCENKRIKEAFRNPAFIS
jgi:hypothetical protein